MRHSSVLLSLALAAPVALSATAAVAAQPASNDDGVGFHFVADDIHISGQQSYDDDIQTSSHRPEDDIHISSDDAKTPWGLDRLDQQALPLDGKYTPAVNGTTSDVYIFDTGIQSDHPEFTGRVGEGFTVFEDEHGTEDCHGHGTGVASVVAGNLLGVANKARLHSVRVLDCDGRGSKEDFMKGLNHVEENALPGAIVVMPLGGKFTAEEFAAFDRLERKGISIALTAGSSEKDACDNFPDRDTTAYVVGATTNKDQGAWFSNYGGCVDAMAPGTDITVAKLGGGTEVKSGGSYAAAHAAGVMALAVEKHPKATPSELRGLLNTGAVSGALTETKGSPNLLLNVQFLDEKPGDPNDENPRPGFFENTESQDVANHSKVTSTIESNYGDARRVTVRINMDHACAEHLQLTLVAPDGSATTLKPPSMAFGDDCDVWNGQRSQGYDVTSPSDGEWTLHVRDYFGGASGTLNSWSLEFSK